MARISKVRITFPRQTSTLITFTRGVLQNVKTNIKFPDLNLVPPPEPDSNVPSYTVVKTAVDALEAQEIIVIQGGTKAETSLRDNLKDVLVAPVTGMLVKWAIYVQEKCGTDVTSILSSGFFVTDQPQRVDTLPQPEFLKVVTQSKRTVTFSVKPVNKADGYGWSVQKADANWQPLADVAPIQQFSSAARCRFTNLQSGAHYLATAYAMGTRDTVSTETDPIQFICL